MGEWRQSLANEKKYKIMINNEPENKTKLYDINANFIDVPHDNESKIHQANKTDYYPTKLDIKRSQRQKRHILHGISKSQSLSPNLKEYDYAAAKSTAERKFRLRSISHFLMKSADIKN